MTAEVIARSRRAKSNGGVELKFLRRKPHGSLLGVCRDDSGIGAALIRRNPGHTPVLEWASQVSGSDTPRALQEIARLPHLRDVECTSVIHSADYSLVLVDAPDVPPSELREAVRWRVNELIDFHIDDAVIDIFDVPGTAELRSKRLYAVAARRAAVARVIHELTDAGFNLNTIDIPELAVRNLAALLPEDTNGVALVTLEAARGLITVTRQGELYLSRRLDYGTERLWDGDLTELTPALEGRLDTLSIEIQRSLDYYERHFAQPSIQAVVLSPSSQPLASVCAYLQSQLGVVVRVLDLNDVLNPATALDPDVQARCLPAICAALRDEEVVL